MNLSRTIAGLVFTAGFLVAQMAAAQSTQEAAQEPDRIDGIHEDWSQWVLKKANDIDGFFSNSQADEDAQKTRIRAWVMGRYDGNEDFKLRLRVRARLSLPETEGRLSLVIGDEEDERRLDELDDSQQNVSLQLRSQKDTLFKQIRFDLGVRRRDSRYQPYVRARHMKVVETQGLWVPRFTNSFYYFTKSKFEYRGEAQFDRVFGRDFFFRPTSVLRWYENNPDECDGGWCFDQFLSLYQRLNRSQSEALAYDIEIYLRDKGEHTVYDTVLKTRYRRMTSKEWMFWEVEPGIHFPSKYDYDPTFRLTLKLEGVFGYNTKANINDYFTPLEADWANKKKPTD